MQTPKYKRITDDEREEISRGLAKKNSIRQIAKTLGRSPSSIMREIQRNRSKTGYRALSASRKAKQKASSRKFGKSKIAKLKPLREYVMDKLQQEWSPQEISERMKMDIL